MDVLSCSGFKVGDVVWDSYYEEYATIDRFIVLSNEAWVYSIPQQQRYIADLEYLTPVSSLVKELL
jgi:hypothetical protein